MSLLSEFLKRKLLLLGEIKVFANDASGTERTRQAMQRFNNHFADGIVSQLGFEGYDVTADELKMQIPNEFKKSKSVKYEATATKNHLWGDGTLARTVDFGIEVTL